MLSLTVKKLDAFKFDGSAESDNSVLREERGKEGRQPRFSRVLLVAGFTLAGGRRVRLFYIIFFFSHFLY